MEKNINTSHQTEVFDWLPVGYMIASLGEIPQNFLIVDGQNLQKSEHPEVFAVLEGTVQEDKYTFTLPTKEQLKTLFSDSDCLNKQIILKLF